MCHTNWRFTVAQILTKKIVITTFSLLPVKHGINHTAAMGNFAWAIKRYDIRLVIKRLLIMLIMPSSVVVVPLSLLQLLTCATLNLVTSLPKEWHRYEDP